jgi:hypothetical protein
MTDTVQNTAANANRKPAYNLAGSISQIEVKTDKRGNLYTTAMFDTVVAGKSTVRRAMAFGKAHLAIEGLQEGPCRLYVTFDGGVFSVIGLGLPPKSEAAAA